MSTNNSNRPDGWTTPLVTSKSVLAAAALVAALAAPVSTGATPTQVAITQTQVVKVLAEAKKEPTRVKKGKKRKGTKNKNKKGIPPQVAQKVSTTWVSPSLWNKITFAPIGAAAAATTTISVSSDSQASRARIEQITAKIRTTSPSYEDLKKMVGSTDEIRSLQKVFPYDTYPDISDKLFALRYEVKYSVSRIDSKTGRVTSEIQGLRIYGPDALQRLAVDIKSGWENRAKRVFSTYYTGRTFEEAHVQRLQGILYSNSPFSISTTTTSTTGTLTPSELGTTNTKKTGPYTWNVKDLPSVTPSIPLATSTTSPSPSVLKSTLSVPTSTIPTITQTEPRKESSTATIPTPAAITPTPVASQRDINPGSPTTPTVQAPKSEKLTPAPRAKETLKTPPKQSDLFPETLKNPPSVQKQEPRKVIVSPHNQEVQKTIKIFLKIAKQSIGSDRVRSTMSSTNVTSSWATVRNYGNSIHVLNHMLSDDSIPTNITRAIYVANAIEKLLHPDTIDRDRLTSFNTSPQKELQRAENEYKEKRGESNMNEIVWTTLLLLMISGDKENIQFALEYSKTSKHAIPTDLLVEIGNTVDAYQDLPVIKTGEVSRYSIAQDTIRAYKAKHIK